MGKEIERKFLVISDDWHNDTGTRYRQGYLNREKERTVRVRVAGDKGYLTVKGITTGAVRSEFDYEIPISDAETMLEELCEHPLIEKVRYRVAFENVVFEIDAFFGDNQGLVIAELELEEENQPFPRPAWLGKEVTDDPRYFNSNLVRNPYSQWK